MGDVSAITVYADMGVFGHCVAYVSDGDYTAISFWVVPGTLED